ncbi:phosphatidylcholine transfer protein-like [Lineus longissimus]|uniref:phosphatidylcholine transfer protein-like n=1 Tax=Lineus longissimus TaxID=88925 RepID=UPI002B4E7B60
MSALGFTDADFQCACEELHTPKLTEEWSFFTESHDIKIYRSYNEISGLYSYKVYGELREVLPEVCSDVYMDLEYRKKWDSYVKDLYQLDRSEETGGNKIIYWNVNYPMMMSNRDYVYSRELRVVDDNDGNKIWVVLAKSVPVASIPKKSGVIRVDDYLQSCALTTNKAGGTKAFMKYYDNPGGMIPTWLINWGAKTGVPSFLTSMQKACRGYAKYLKEREEKEQAAGK